MEVDRPSALELGHLGIGDPHQSTQLALLEADQPAQGTLDGDGGPAPQLRGQGVPQHLRLRVIAVRAERLAQPGVVLLVAMPAAGPLAVRAAGTLPVGVTRQDEPALALRVWTLPNDGAVKVTNSRGCSLIVSGMPLPPRRPAARSW